MTVIKKRVAVLISGRGSNMEVLVAACADARYPAEIIAVLSNKADAKGLVFAASKGITAISIPNKDYPSRAAHDAAMHDALSGLKPDIVVLAGYMRLMTAEFVEQWRGKMVNIHPALLPDFRGLHTHQRALDAGVKTHGCTVHFVTAGMDEGPTIAQAKVPVLDDDTPETLTARVLIAEHRLYPAALRLIADGTIAMDSDFKPLIFEI